MSLELYLTPWTVEPSFLPHPGISPQTPTADAYRDVKGHPTPAVPDTMSPSLVLQ